MVNKMEIKGKTALVTGGASGIGLACVRELLKHGAQVVVCDRDAARSEEILQELQNEFGSGKAIFIKTDVTKEKELEDAFTAAISTFKTLDIVLNNAGITEVGESWEATIEVNINAVVRGCQLAFKFMGKNNGGRGGVVCNTSSVTAFIPAATMPVYCATKHAIIGLTRSYGMPSFMETSHVRVFAVCPSSTETPLLNAFLSASRNEVEEKDVQAQFSTLPPRQKAEDVAAGVMVMLQTAESGSIWVSEGGEPVYEVEIPVYHDMRKTC